MKKDIKNKNKPGSEMIPFNISKLSTLKYIKVIFADENKELHELQTEVNFVNNDIIQLYFNIKENVGVTCPIGVVLKFVTFDAIYFAKTILKEVKNVNGKILFILDTPQKAIRQQNREFFRINLYRPCVLSINNNKNSSRIYIAQSVNISKGGILMDNIESMFDDEPIRLKLSRGDNCHIVIFLEQGLKFKSNITFIRSEYVDESYRCAFQFFNTLKKYIIPFDKYLTNEEYKLLKSIKNS